MFFLVKLLTRNALRQKLRIGLTMVGLVVAICAFGLLRTIVDAWYAGVEAGSSIRLVTRNSISLVFPLPLNYAQRIQQVEGVNGLSWGNWFGGVYITERNFFPQFGIGPTYFDLYPELLVRPEEMKAFNADQQGVVVGRKLANQFGWKLGDQVPLRGTIYPGTWTFNVRAIYDGIDNKTDESQFLFHWSYLNESIKKRYGARRGDQIGFYVERLANPDDAAAVSKQVDTIFRNSLAETLTETEKAFQLGFISMTELILIAIQAVSFVVILIIMAVMANTIAMTARERTSEYATLKALGFGPGFIGWLILGESLFVALLGGIVGVIVTFPVASAFARTMGTLFPIFFVSRETVLLQLAAAATIGLVAAAFPAWRSGRIRIVDGLRHVA